MSDVGAAVMTVVSAAGAIATVIALALVIRDLRRDTSRAWMLVPVTSILLLVSGLVFWRQTGDTTLLLLGAIGPAALIALWREDSRARAAG